MRVAFSCEEDAGLESKISEHFGRSPYFILVDMEGEEIKKVESVVNPYYGFSLQPGMIPRFLKDKGVKIVTTGGIGRRAVDFFTQWGMEVFTAQGRVKEALLLLKENKLIPASPCKER